MIVVKNKKEHIKIAKLLLDVHKLFINLILKIKQLFF